MATVFSVVLGPVKSFMTASRAAFGLGSDSEDCSVRVVDVALAPERGRGAAAADATAEQRGAAERRAAEQQSAPAEPGRRHARSGWGS